MTERERALFFEQFAILVGAVNDVRREITELRRDVAWIHRDDPRGPAVEAWSEPEPAGGSEEMT